MSVQDDAAGENERLRRRIAELEQNQLSPEHRLKLEILDHLPFTIWVGTRDFKISFWNTECERAYGYSREQALGRDYIELFVDPLESEQSREDCRAIIDEGKVFRNFLAYDRTREGLQRTMLTNCFRIRDARSQELVQVEVGVDVGDLEPSKEAHRSLRALALTRKQERETLIRCLKVDLISAITGAFARKTLPLMSEEQGIREYKASLLSQGLSETAVEEAIADKLEKINIEMTGLETWHHQSIARVTRAVSLEELETVRQET